MSARPPERVERLAYFTTKRLLESDAQPMTLSISSTASRLSMRCTGRVISPGLEVGVSALSGTLQDEEDDVIVIEIPCE